ncbi:unnamed protein product [Leuciscus chuanchicus]
MKKYENVVVSSRKEIKNYKKESGKTGGGPPPQDLSETSKLLQEILGKDSPTLVGIAGMPQRSSGSRQSSEERGSARDETKKKVYVELVEYNLNYAFKRGVLRNYSGKNESLELFSADPGHSYSCSAETVYMGDGVSLVLTNYRLQAFNIKNKKFGTTDLCKADKPDYRIPIAVGIILIILIVIVVIAYLISRKRRSNGYQSL